MPTATELLSTEACDDILVVDLESRTIVIPKTVSVLGVEADDETRILHFQVPQYYCNVDLSEFSIRVNYKNANGEPDMYLVLNKVVENGLIKFDWVVGRHAFVKKGNVKFSVCLKDLFEGIVKREFNTTPATLPVLEGLETGPGIVEEYSDTLELLMANVDSEAQRVVETVVESKMDGCIKNLAVQSLSVTAELSAAGWYRIGTIRGDIVDASYVRAVISGRYNSTPPVPIVVDIFHTYGGAIALYQLPTNSDPCLITKVRAVRQDASTYAIDVYYAVSHMNPVDVIIQPTFATFTAGSFTNVTGSTETITASINLTKVGS